MARFGTVKLSTVMKYNRLDPEFYLGSGPEELEKAKRLEDRAHKLKQSATEIRKNRKKNQARIRRMERKGEVTRID